MMKIHAKSFAQPATMVLLFGILAVSSCKKDLLDQIPTTQLSTDLYWKTFDDAVYAVNGVYQANKNVFGTDYQWDGGGEFVQTRRTVLGKGDFNPGPLGSAYDYYWAYCYTTINRANDVLEHIKVMEPTLKTNSEVDGISRLKAETRFLRALTYFRMIDLWGDVPYLDHKLAGNSEAYSYTRTPKAQIKDSILADLNYAVNTLAETPYRNEKGRATRNAAIAFSGKVKLFWASWMKNAGNQTEAQTYYAAAAADFKKIIDKNIPLFRGGDPGPANKPNYGDLFQYTNENDPEILYSIDYTGPGLSQGELMLYEFGNRNTANGTVQVAPTYRLINRYQSTATGDFVTPVVLSNSATAANGAVNPNTYVGRDYRLKATVLWDGQKMLQISTDGMTLGDSITWKWGSRDGVVYINYDNTRAGYQFRKWVRQVGGFDRSDGPQDMYLMRVADVWLMYCEAVNEANGSPAPELFDLLDKIRRRGNLPPLNRALFASKTAFFKAVEQERIIELVGEGQRFFDIRRWNKAEEIWPMPAGQTLYDPWGVRVRDEFKNAPIRDYQRYYLFRIPPSEIIVNSKLVQNTPWL